LHAHAVAQAISERSVQPVTIETVDTPPVSDAPLAVDEHFVVQRQVDCARVERVAVERIVHCNEVPQASPEILALDPTLLEAQAVCQVDLAPEARRYQRFLVQPVLA